MEYTGPFLNVNRLRLLTPPPPFDKLRTRPSGFYICRFIIHHTKAIFTLVLSLNLSIGNISCVPTRILKIITFVPSPHYEPMQFCRNSFPLATMTLLTSPFCMAYRSKKQLSDILVGNDLIEKFTVDISDFNGHQSDLKKTKALLKENQRLLQKF